jgi:hypothetical protein
MKDLFTHLLTFFLGLIGGLLSHVQKPLTDYRKTLTDISATIIANTLLMYGDPRHLYPLGDQANHHNEQLMKLYSQLRVLHAKLLSSSSMIPRFARPLLRLFGLLRSPVQINEGAKMLIGISNQVISSNKELPHLTELIKRLEVALDINAGG